jgi:hypothetical protein
MQTLHIQLTPVQERTDILRIGVQGRQQMSFSCGQVSHAQE